MINNNAVNSAPLFSPEVRDSLRDFFGCAFGIIIGFVSVYFAIALISYSPFNPSANTVHPSVDMSTISAVVAGAADFLLSYLGALAAWSLAFFGMRVSYLMIRGRRPVFTQTHAVFGLLSIILFSFSAGLFNPRGINGGWIGQIFAHDVLNFLPYNLHSFIGFVIFAGAATLLFFALQLRGEHIKKTSVLTGLCLATGWNLIRRRPIPIASDDEPESTAEPRTRRAYSARKRPVQTTTGAHSASRRRKWMLPSSGLLEDFGVKLDKGLTADNRSQAQAIERFMERYGVRGRVENIKIGPRLTIYEYKPDLDGQKISSIISKTPELSMALESANIRVAQIPNTQFIGIEVPNMDPVIVSFRRTIESAAFRNPKVKIPIALGEDIGGKSVVADLFEMPHLLVGGATKTGKSVFLTSVLLSLMYKFTPDECRLVIIDPKTTEFVSWGRVPHLAEPLVENMSQMVPEAVRILTNAVAMMESRYQSFNELARAGGMGISKVGEFNAAAREMRESGSVPTRRVATATDEDGNLVYEDKPIDLTPMPYIIMILDEYADLMNNDPKAAKEIEVMVGRLLAKGRAAGFHLIIATQRPDVKVINGTLKSNLPARISFKVATQIDSRTILDDTGAEKLLGNGDMFYKQYNDVLRAHGAFATKGDEAAVSKFWAAQGEPQILEQLSARPKPTPDPRETAKTDRVAAKEAEDDGIYAQACDLVIEKQKATCSLLQMKLRVGYGRASGMLDKMEQDGIVSPQDVQGKRRVLVGS